MIALMVVYDRKGVLILIFIKDAHGPEFGFGTDTVNCYWRGRSQCS
jgi:hypothetical protein